MQTGARKPKPYYKYSDFLSDYKLKVGGIMKLKEWCGENTTSVRKIDKKPRIVRFPPKGGRREGFIRPPLKRMTPPRHCSFQPPPQGRELNNLPNISGDNTDYRLNNLLNISFRKHLVKSKHLAVDLFACFF